MKRIILCTLITLFILDIQAKILLTQSNLFNVDIESGVEFVVKEELNLHGKQWNIPHNCSLKFQGNGCFCNGVLLGNNTYIKAGRQLIFRKDVKILGTWNNSTVYSEWANLEDSTDCKCQFQNLMVLCNGRSKTNLFVEKGVFFVSAIENDAPIMVPSRVYWHNSATIQILPCNYKSYSLVKLQNVEDVSIDGGVFVGDVASHLGKEGEWGHGIKLSGSRRVILKNLTCINFWGDGIDLIEQDYEHQYTFCDSIVISNVKCLYNRRQGMSIEAAHNVIAKNCEFAYTGKPQATAPSAGVDIEPWNTTGNKVANIKFVNCSFHDNTGSDFLSLAGWLNKSTDLYSIELRNCTIGKVQIDYSSGVKIDKSQIYGCLNVNTADVVYVSNSYVKDANCSNKVIFTNCNNK